MACSLLPVSYPAHSASPIGDFQGGDCIITLSDATLSISSPHEDGHLIASWRYCTIRSFNCSSTEFCFISGRRGPYGVEEYTFKVSPTVMSSLFSVLSKTTGVNIQRDITPSQPGDSSPSSDQSLSSDCYKLLTPPFILTYHPILLVAQKAIRTTLFGLPFLLSKHPATSLNKKGKQTEVTWYLSLFSQPLQSHSRREFCPSSISHSSNPRGQRGRIRWELRCTQLHTMVVHGQQHWHCQRVPAAETRPSGSTRASLL
eukprot:Em0002g1382a